MKLNNKQPNIGDCPLYSALFSDCRGFELLVPTTGGDTVFLYEVYADQAAIDHHMQTPYMKQYLADTGPMIAARERTLCSLASQ